VLNSINAAPDGHLYAGEERAEGAALLLKRRSRIV